MNRGRQRRNLEFMFHDLTPRAAQDPAQRPKDPRPETYWLVSPALNTSTSIPCGPTSCFKRSGVPVSTGNVP